MVSAKKFLLPLSSFLLERQVYPAAVTPFDTPEPARSLADLSPEQIGQLIPLREKLRDFRSVNQKMAHIVDSDLNLTEAEIELIPYLEMQP